MLWPGDRGAVTDREEAGEINTVVYQKLDRDSVWTNNQVCGHWPLVRGAHVVIVTWLPSLAAH